GAQAALPIWMDFMGQALEGQPERWPDRPESVVTERVDPDTGRLLRDGQSGGIEELFMADHLPEVQSRRVEREVERESGSQGTGAYEAIF
ncbi:MAG: penicillin-binding protein 1A, partial [Pseudomonadota bacterium]